MLHPIVASIFSQLRSPWLELKQAPLALCHLEVLDLPLAFIFRAFGAVCSRQFAEGVEGADGVGEVFADVGGEHCAHAEFFGGEITGQAADV
jgi:hypothetical protein